MRKVISELCNISEKSYYVWKSKSHIKLLHLLEKYFTKEDLEEFLSTGKISRHELIKDLTVKNIEELKIIKHNTSIINQIEELKKGLIL